MQVEEQDDDAQVWVLVFLHTDLRVALVDSFPEEPYPRQVARKKEDEGPSFILANNLEGHSEKVNCQLIP